MNSVVSNNIAATNSGGFHISQDAHVVSNSIICHNRVTGPYAYSGGGGTLYRGGRIANCLIYGNQDNAGGGGIYVNRNAVIESCTIAGNDGYFGGLYLIAGDPAYTIQVMNSISCPTPPSQAMRAIVWRKFPHAFHELLRHSLRQRLRRGEYNQLSDVCRSGRRQLPAAIRIALHQRRRQPGMDGGRPGFGQVAPHSAGPAARWISAVTSFTCVLSP